jgi:hypothetical protein
VLALDTTSISPTDLLTIDAQWLDIQRYDKKFLMELHDVQTFINDHHAVLKILEIEAQRSFHYITEYYDTPEFALYQDHYRRRRRRIKVRIRHYSGSGLSQCEVKARSGNSLTRKFIFPESTSLGIAEREFICSTLKNLNLFERLSPTINQLLHVATTTFDRITLNRTDVNEKITIDLNFVVSTDERSLAGSTGLALVEVKSTASRTRTRSDFAKLGVLPIRFSKYASVIEMLVSERPRVNSRRSLERAFALTSAE